MKKEVIHLKKSIVNNYLYNLSYQLLILILPLVTTPYISRVLGAHGVGTFSYTNSITQYFILFGCVGLNLYGQREIAYVQSDKKKYSKVFFELLIIRFITISISIIIFYFTLCRNNKYALIFMIQIIDVVASIFDISWLFQGLEDFKKIVIRNFIIKILGVILIFLFIKNNDDLGLYVLMNSMTLIFGNLSMWMYLPQTISKINFSNLELKQHIQPSLALFVPQIATSLYTMLDKTMIGYITQNESEVAFYEQSQKLIKLVLTLVTSFGTVMMPRIARIYAENNQEKIKSYMSLTFKMIFVLAMPLCFGLMAIATNFVPWFFGQGYEKVVPNMIVIAPIIIFISMSNVTGTQFLLPTQRQREYTLSVIIGSVVNFILNILFIPYFLSVGAAIATFFAELSVTVVQLVFVRKDFALKEILKYGLRYGFYSCAMAIIVYLIGIKLNANFITTCVQCVIGVLLYMALLFVCKDNMIQVIKDKIKKQF